MKTFEEAVTAVMARKIDSADAETPADLTENCERYVDIHREVQRHHITAILIEGMLTSFDISLEALMTLAFSHGVVVGMEMEKP